MTADRKGDPQKQPPECRGAGPLCPHLREIGGGFEGEFYECDVCGEYYKLWYEDMA